MSLHIWQMATLAWYTPFRFCYPFELWSQIPLKIIKSGYKQGNQITRVWTSEPRRELKGLTASLRFAFASYSNHPSFINCCTPNHLSYYPSIPIFFISYHLPSSSSSSWFFLHPLLLLCCLFLFPRNLGNHHLIITKVQSHGFGKILLPYISNNQLF